MTRKIRDPVGVPVPDDGTDFDIDSDDFWVGWLAEIRNDEYDRFSTLSKTSLLGQSTQRAQEQLRMPKPDSGSGGYASAPARGQAAVQREQLSQQSQTQQQQQQNRSAALPAVHPLNDSPVSLDPKRNTAVRKEEEHSA